MTKPVLERLSLRKVPCSAPLRAHRSTDCRSRSIIINHLETLAHPDVGIGYLYCSYKEERHTAINLLSSLLMQLIHRKGVIPDDIAYLFDEYHEMDSRPTLQEYIALLQAQVRQFRRVFIVVDGLDECTDVDGTRRALVSVLRDMLPGISLLVTARPKVGEEYFTEAPRIDIKARESDLKGYIDHRVSQTPTSRLSRFYRSCDATIQEEIRNTIVGKAQGM